MQHLCIGVKPVHFIVIVVDRRGMWASLVWVGLARIHRYYIRCSPHLLSGDLQSIGTTSDAPLHFLSGDLRTGGANELMNCFGRVPGVY